MSAINQRQDPYIIQHIFCFNFLAGGNNLSSVAPPHNLILFGISITISFLYQINFFVTSKLNYEFYKLISEYKGKCNMCFIKHREWRERGGGPNLVRLIKKKCVVFIPWSKHMFYLLDGDLICQTGHVFCIETVSKFILYFILY